MRLNPDTVATYLQERGIVPVDEPVTVEPLGGGVSNGVFRAEWENDAVVIKQPLPDLDVEDDWPADVNRVHNEAAAGRVYATVLAESELETVVVPTVRFEDHTQHVIGISAAPRSARMWKTDLLNGQIDVSIAETAASFLAEAHEFAKNDTEIEEVFSNYEPFEQLRIEPYHRTVADRHPDVATPIEAEIERMNAARSTLVHGDFSPKNVLVDETNVRPQLWMLDFEVAHWGDPAFDVAFMLNHLFIKSLYNDGKHDEYVTAARAVWDNYRWGRPVRDSFERDVVSELGVLMLARVDGKSPVEYVEDEETKETLRSVAKRALQTDVLTLEAFITELRPEVDTK